MSRFPYLFFLLSIILALTSSIFDNYNLFTKVIGEANIPILTFLFIIFILVTILSFGIEFIDWRDIKSPDNIFGISLVTAGVSFLVIFINGPIIGKDLNEPINLLNGIFFMLSIIGIFIGGFRH